MEIFIYIPILCAAAGAALGWISKPRFFPLLAECLLASFIVMGAIVLFMSGPPESLSPRALFTGAIYYILPYLALALLPAVLAAWATSMSRFKSSRSGPKRSGESGSQPRVNP